MARNGSGTYNLLTNSWNPATNGVSATAVDWQNLINDVAAALTQSLSADGQTPMTGNLNAGNNKITGLAAGTGTGQSIRWEQVFTAPASFGGGAINVDASGNVGIGTNTAGSPGLFLPNILNISFSEPTLNTSIATMFRQASSGDLVLGSGVRYSSTVNGYASSTGSPWARSAINVGYGSIKFLTAAEATVSVGTDTTLTERMRIDASGNVGIGTTTPGTATRLNVAGRGLFTSGAYDPEDSTASGVSISYDTVNNVGIVGAVQTGIVERELRFRGSSISVYTNGANERVRVDASGNFLLTSATGVLGYGAGAGGTVTQSTSKSTAVTLNRPSGRIIMNNAALAANTSVVFSLNNSTMIQGDTLSVCIVGGTAGVATYEVNCFYNNSAPAYITLKNITGGALSEAVQIQFNVIRGSTS